VYLTQDATDAALVQRVLAGDTDAFAPLVDRYQRVLFTVAYRMLGNRADAADVAQSAFVKAFEKLGSYDPHYRFFSWLYRIALNECLNLQRARRPVEPLNAAGAIAPAAHAILEVAERRQRIQDALLRLPADYREALVLHYFADLSYEEIAVAVAVPVKTVKSRLYTGRQRLADLLGGVLE
jgi:RNA polymerase sigma-70 factor (ECF subfamily)